MVYKLLKKTVSNDETRPFINHAYRQDNRVYSTNGKFMAVFNKKGENGYCIINDKTSEIINVEFKGYSFPDVKRVIPSKEGYERFKITVPAIKALSRKYTPCQVHLTKESNFVFGNTEDFLAHFDFKALEVLTEKDLYVWVKDKNSVLIFEEEGKFTESNWFYLVMPLRK